MWTKEPWNLEVNRSNGVHHLRGIDDRWICTADDADADRIMACVNAMAGIDDPAQLRAQRDKLLAACKALVERDDVIRYGSLSRGVGEEYKRRVATARATIAEAETKP